MNPAVIQWVTKAVAAAAAAIGSVKLKPVVEKLFKNLKK